MGSSAWNPWAELAARPEIELRWIARGGRGCIDFATRVITLNLAMGHAERRSVVSHELVHDERGPVPRWLVPREEAWVRQESARRLVDLHELADVMRGAEYIEDVAEDLGVDVPTLRTRLEHLHPSERAVLLRALGEDDESAES